MSVMDRYRAQRKAEADAALSAEEIAALPRLCLKKNRYGTTFCAINEVFGERMIVQRQVVSFHCEDVIAKHPGVSFHPEVMVDCWECRLERKRLMDMWAADGADAERIIEKLQDWRNDGDLYWCNGCQGTGWLHEPWEDAVARHGTVTWKDKAMALPGAELAALMKVPKWQSKWPHEVLVAEGARRLEAFA